MRHGELRELQVEAVDGVLNGRADIIDDATCGFHRVGDCVLDRVERVLNARDNVADILDCRLNVGRNGFDDVFYNWPNILCDELNLVTALTISSRMMGHTVSTTEPMNSKTLLIVS